MGFSPFLPLTQPAMCHKPRDYGSTPWFKLGRKSYLQEPPCNFLGYFSEKSEFFGEWYSEMVLWTLCLASNRPFRHLGRRSRKVCVFDAFCHCIPAALYIKCHSIWVAETKFLPLSLKIDQRRKRILSRCLGEDRWIYMILSETTVNHHHFRQAKGITFTPSSLV